MNFTTTALAERATLSRQGAVHGAGIARISHGHISLRLEPLRSLRSGKYRLTLISGTGRHERVSRQSFTLS